MGTEEHKATAPRNLSIGVLSVSTTRTLAKEGHQVACHRVIPDDAKVITQTVLDVLGDHSPHALLILQ